MAVARRMTSGSRHTRYCSNRGGGPRQIEPGMLGVAGKGYPDRSAYLTRIFVLSGSMEYFVLRRHS